MLKIRSEQRIALIIATIFAIVGGLWFLKSYLILIILSAIAVVLFNPVFKYLMKIGRPRGQAAMLTFLISLLAVIIPIIFVVIISIFQIDKFVSAVGSGSYSFNASEFLNNAINYVNELLTKIGVTTQISTTSVTQAVSNAVEQFGQAILESILSYVSGVFAFITTAIIYIYVFMSMLLNQEKIIKVAKSLNPLGDEISDLYIARMHAMTKATVRGQFIIAFCQGTWSAAILAMTGLSDLFFFFWMLLTILSIVPLGAGIVTIPIGIGMILTGNIWQGIVVIANHLLIVTNIDNVLRPKLVPKEARLDSALMILAVFSGLALFGFIGIVIGPVLMIIIVTTIQIYLEVFRQTKSIRDKEIKTKKISKLSKLAFWQSKN